VKAIVNHDKKLVDQDKHLHKDIKKQTIKQS